MIIFHVFGAFLFVCFIAGVSPLLIPSMRTPFRGATCRPRGRISEFRRDPSKILLSGVRTGARIAIAVFAVATPLWRKAFWLWAGLRPHELNSAPPFRCRLLQLDAAFDDAARCLLQGPTGFRSAGLWAYSTALESAPPPCMCPLRPNWGL